jgi:hypothetical protein
VCVCACVCVCVCVCFGGQAPLKVADSKVARRNECKRAAKWSVWIGPVSDHKNNRLEDFRAVERAGAHLLEV